MANYVICPRCELNFIDADVQEYCDVCIKELSGERTFSDDFEAEENTEETELCPVCGENFMVLGEKMCEECKKKSEYEEETQEDDDKEDASWRSYLDDEDDKMEDLGIPDSEFEDDEEEEEEEEMYEEEEFEYVSADDYNPDEDDEDDEDDDFDSFDDDDAPSPKTSKKKKARDDDDF